MENTRKGKGKGADLDQPEILAGFWHETLGNLLDQAGQAVFLAFDELKPVGYLSVAVKDLLGRFLRPGVTVTGLFVLESHRGASGAFVELWRTARTFVKPFGFARIQSAIYIDNEPMHRHLEKAGWTKRAILYEKPLGGDNG